MEAKSHSKKLFNGTCVGIRISPKEVLCNFLYKSKGNKNENFKNKSL